MSAGPPPGAPCSGASGASEQRAGAQPGQASGLPTIQAPPEPQNTPCSSQHGAGLAPMSPCMTGTFSDLWAGKALAQPCLLGRPFGLPGPPSLASTCLQRHRDVLVPVTPDHLGASRLERCHQGPLLRLLLQPVADVLGPTELPSLLPGTGGHRPGGSNGWGRAAASAAWLRVKDCCLLSGGASLLCRG